MSDYLDLLQNIQALKETLTCLAGANDLNTEQPSKPTKRCSTENLDESNVKKKCEANINESDRKKELWINRFGAVEFFGNVIEDYDSDPYNVQNGCIFDSHCHLDRIFFGPTNEPGLYRQIGLGLPRSSVRDMGEKNNQNLPHFKPLEYLKSKFPETFGDKFEGCITVCCDPEYWQEEKMEWLLQEENVWLTIGCHPSKALLYNREKENFIKRYLKHDKIVALGEIGLDESWYTRGGVTKESQHRAFAAQIEIASTYEKQKAICIHLRGEQSVEDAYEILKSSTLARNRRIHMHCIGATKMSVIKRWMQEWPNMMFGITSNYFLMEVGKLLPLDRILLETDSPYFVPKKFCEDTGGKPKHPGATGRSKRYPIANPGMVFHVAAQISKIRGISIDEVLFANRRNIEICYGVKQKLVRHKKKELNVNIPENDDASPGCNDNEVEIKAQVDWSEWSENWGDVNILDEEKIILNNK